MSPFAPIGLPFPWELWIAARLLPLFVRNRPLHDILKLANPTGSSPGRDPMPADAIVRAVKRAAARPWLMRHRRCLREGLLGFHYLSREGYRPLLHFGIIPESLASARPKAHCWISLDGTIILNPPEVPMLDLFTYDGSRSAPATRAHGRLEPMNG
ncbi:transglutaminase superfamily protein [Hoeflea marina]|uniref:Transglutaminase superfamily protein n=1 Tax=Hoeflea marina TaxID=274592 RepID=A0A317PN29_9HYPH|nr:lasso peptide biosynthesis B2 protein [Hoeflea marina]PWV99900.1 transglutaminase superfamily protein [Hoeflea marina]